MVSFCFMFGAVYFFLYVFILTLIICPNYLVEDKYALLYVYRTHTPVIIGFMILLCHYQCEMGYFLGRNSSVTGLLHNRIMAPNKQEYLSLSQGN